MAEERPMTDTELVIWRAFEKMQGQIAAEIRVMLGESAYAQSIFDESQRHRRIRSMIECAGNSTSDIERHESWTKMHIESGWVYGPKFDPEKKEHPNLLPWDQLPESTRSKAKIFAIVSCVGRDLVNAFNDMGVPPLCNR